MNARTEVEDDTGGGSPLDVGHRLGLGVLELGLGGLGRCWDTGQLNVAVLRQSATHLRTLWRVMFW